MAQKSERGKKALGTIAEASGVSVDTVIRVLAATHSSEMRQDAMDYAASLVNDTAAQADSHEATMQAAVDKGTQELGVKDSSTTSSETSGQSSSSETAPKS